MISTPGCPQQGLTSFSTVGLSDYSVPGSLRPPLGSEIAVTSNFPQFGAVVATAGFQVAGSRWTEPLVGVGRLGLSLALPTPVLTSTSSAPGPHGRR